MSELKHHTHEGAPAPRRIFLAGGCFWGVEAYFRRIPGVLETQVGYANGRSAVTSYHELHATDHAETLALTYDAFAVSLAELLAHYFRLIDPVSVNRQGNDCGRQYRTGIYYEVGDAEAREQAERSLAQLQTHYAEPLAVELEELRNFVPAEDYHQDYLEKNPSGYCHIDLSLAARPLWLGPPLRERPTLEQLRAELSPIAFHVTQEEGTEPPRSSEFDQFDERGIYVDVVSGQALFSSRDKFDAGCGWPSFTRPVLSGATQYHVDNRLWQQRIEVKSGLAASHLGHVFSDGPRAAGGMRYCIDGAALRFIPEAQMAAEGYGDFLPFL